MSQPIKIERTFSQTFTNGQTTPKYFTLIYTPDSENMWWQKDLPNAPGFLDFELYEIADGSENGKACIWYGNENGFPGTTNITEAIPMLSGFAKWDGCFQFLTGPRDGEGGYQDIDTAEEMELFISALRYLR